MENVQKQFTKEIFKNVFSNFPKKKTNRQNKLSICLKFLQILLYFVFAAGQQHSLHGVRTARRAFRPLRSRRGAASNKRKKRKLKNKFFGKQIKKNVFDRQGKIPNIFLKNPKHQCVTGRYVDGSIEPECQDGTLVEKNCKGYCVACTIPGEKNFLVFTFFQISILCGLML